MLNNGKFIALASFGLEALKINTHFLVCFFALKITKAYVKHAYRVKIWYYLMIQRINTFTSIQIYAAKLYSSISQANLYLQDA